MQNIITETRQRIAPFLGEKAVMQFGPVMRGEKSERLARNIPKQNYADLDKMVPISWL